VGPLYCQEKLKDFPDPGLRRKWRLIFFLTLSTKSYYNVFRCKYEIVLGGVYGFYTG